MYAHYSQSFYIVNAMPFKTRKSFVWNYCIVVWYSSKFTCLFQLQKDQLYSNRDSDNITIVDLPEKLAEGYRNVTCDLSVSNSEWQFGGGTNGTARAEHNLSRCAVAQLLLVQRSSWAWVDVRILEKTADSVLRQWDLSKICLGCVRKGYS